MQASAAIDGLEWHKVFTTCSSDLSPPIDREAIMAKTDQDGTCAATKNTKCIQATAIRLEAITAALFAAKLLTPGVLE